MTMTLCELCGKYGNCSNRNEIPEDKREKIWKCTRFEPPSNVIRIEYGETPWEIANKMINKIIICKNSYFNTEYEGHFFDKDELIKIGKHLINYVETEWGQKNE